MPAYILYSCVIFCLRAAPELSAVAVRTISWSCDSAPLCEYEAPTRALTHLQKGEARSHCKCQSGDYLSLFVYARAQSLSALPCVCRCIYSLPNCIKSDYFYLICFLSLAILIILANFPHELCFVTLRAFQLEIERTTPPRALRP